MGFHFLIARVHCFAPFFFRALPHAWQALDLAPFQGGRVKLIRGWDELFAQLDDHLSSLQSMQQSPFFAVFEDEARAWEDKLARHHTQKLSPHSSPRLQ